VGTLLGGLDVRTRSPWTIIAIAKPVFVGLTVSPDGKSLLYTQIDQETSDLMLVERCR
jgi:hypothetical protein